MNTKTDELRARHAQISAQPLDRTCGGHLSHDEVASKVRMLMRQDLDHEAVCTMARDRIVWLAGRVAELEAAALARQEEGREAVGDVGMSILHRDDTTEVGDETAVFTHAFLERLASIAPARVKLYTHPAPPIAALATHSGGEGDALLTECYMAMQAAMNVIDVNEGPGLEHSRVVNALADCRIKIEQRNASRRLAAATPQSADTDEWEIRADGQRVRKDRWETGFRSIVGILVGARTEFEIPDIVERVRALATAGQQAAGVSVSEEIGRLAMQLDSAASIGDERHLRVTAANVSEKLLALQSTAAGAAPEGWPARYACNGPEGTFWTDDAVLANRLLLHDTAIERDEWTVTDTQQPGAQEKA